MPPCPATAHWWQTQVPGLLLPWDLWLGTYSVGYLLIFKNFSQLCCPLQFQIPHRPADEKASCCLETSSFMTPSPGWVSVPNCLSLFLSFMFCTTSFWREWADFLGAWCLLPAFRNCFVEVAQHSNDLLMNLWRRKWSPCHITLPSWDRPHFLFWVQANSLLWCSSHTHLLVFFSSRKGWILWELFSMYNSMICFFFFLKDNCFIKFCCFLQNLNINQP